MRLKAVSLAKPHNLKELTTVGEKWRTDEKSFQRIPASQPILTSHNKPPRSRRLRAFRTDPKTVASSLTC